MQKGFAFWLLAIALGLAACGNGVSGDSNDGGSSNSMKPAISCADVGNNGATTCSGSAFSAQRVVVAGTVTRSDIITVAIDVANPDTAAQVILLGAIFDAGCGGAPTWPLIDPPQTYTVLGGETRHFEFGGSCGDMPVGGRTLVGTLYDELSEELDSVTVQFTLVN